MANLGEYGDQLAGINFVYPAVAADITAKGWQVVWATLNADGEWTPLVGTTASQGAFPVNRDMPQGVLVRIAFRPPPGVIVFDVDHYAFKLGWHTMERAEDELGTLPPTWKVTSRGAECKSGRYLYAISEGTDTSGWERALRHFGEIDTRGIKTAQFSDVEVVRTGYRFSWAPGDINPKNRELVQCYDPEGRASQLPPVADLPPLPAEWLEFFRDPPRPRVFTQAPPVDVHRPRWWTQVADRSIGTRDELCSHALNLLLSGLDQDEAIDELRRVSLSLDEGDPWRTSDFRGMTDANSQEKAGRVRAEWSAQTAFLESAYKFSSDDKVREAQQAFQERLSRDPLPVTSLPPVVSPVPVRREDKSGWALTMRFELDKETRRVRPLSSDDREIAHDMIIRMAENVKFADDAGHWLIDNGYQWDDWGNKSEAKDKARALAFSYGMLLEEVPPGAGDVADGEPDPYKALKAAHKKLRSTSGASSVGTAAASIAQANPGTCVRVSALDIEPHVLWAAGLPWDLRRSAESLVVAVPGEYNPVHRKTAFCMPDSSVPTPLWDAYLASVWPDPEVRAYAVREVAGVALWGATSKQHPVLHGPASSGKSTFAEQLVRLLGSYAVEVSPNKLLTGRADSTAEEERSKLIGARLAWMDEPPPRRKQAISEFNEMASGTGTISAAAKYKNVVTAPKLFNFLVCQNPRNPLSFDVEGVSERTTFIPCLAQPHYTAATRRAMLRRFSDEAPGVLAALIMECARYRAGDRLPVPVAVKEAFEDARHSMNEWTQVFMDYFEPGPADLAAYKWLTVSKVVEGVNEHLGHRVSGSEAKAHLIKMGFEIRRGNNQDRVNVTWKNQAFGGR